MKKLIILTGVIATLAAQALAAPVGTAQSARSFRISRQNDVIPVDGASAMLNSADKIQTSTAPVRLNTNNGDTIILQEKSSAAMVDASNVDFHSGRLVAALKPGSLMAVHFGPLVIKSIAGVAAKEAAIIGVQSTDSSKLTVVNFGTEPLSVVDSKTGKQVSFLAKGDTMTITRNAPVDGSEVSYAAASSSPLVLQQQAPTDPTADPAVEEDQDSRKKAVPIWWVAGAIVGAGALGYAGWRVYDDQVKDLINGNNNNGNNGNNNRRASSPVLFVPEPIPTE